MNIFLANSCAYAYLGEIEDLGPTKVWKFTLYKPYVSFYSSTPLDIQENVVIYTIYEQIYKNISLPFVLSFPYEKTSDSTYGPILNALDIVKYG